MDAGDTVNFVRVTVETTQANTTRMDPFQVQLWDGTTAQIGTTRTTTDATGAQTDSFDFTGVTFAQLATLRVRVQPMGATGNAQSSSGTVDFVSLTVDYTEPAPQTVDLAAATAAWLARTLVITLGRYTPSSPRVTRGLPRGTKSSASGGAPPHWKQRGPGLPGLSRRPQGQRRSWVTGSSFRRARGAARGTSRGRRGGR